MKTVVKVLKMDARTCNRFHKANCPRPFSKNGFVAAKALIIFKPPQDRPHDEKENGAEAEGGESRPPRNIHRDQEINNQTGAQNNTISDDLKQLGAHSDIHNKQSFQVTNPLGE